nr:hypothetical protein [uncultured Roseateles sp.]
MPIDTTPLHTIGAYTVIAERHDVQFRDDTTVGLHQVLQDGHPCMYLRCFVHDGLHAMLLDLRDLASALAAEIPLYHARDVPGLVMYTLRAKYSGLAEFTAAAMAQSKGGKVLDVMPQRQVQLFFCSGHTEFLKPDTGDRRFFPVHVDGRAYA